jgi:hypothetical protein
LTQFLVDRHLRPHQPPAFDLPEGFPAEMFVYDRFAEERGWPPEVVRRLTRKELFWLPVISAAKAAAAEQVSKIDSKRSGA